EGVLPHASFAEALERLRFALATRGPALLVAPPGTGKSFLLNTLCTSLPASDVRVIPHHAQLVWAVRPRRATVPHDHHLHGHVGDPGRGRVRGQKARQVDRDLLHAVRG